MTLKKKEMFTTQGGIRIWRGGPYINTHIKDGLVKFFSGNFKNSQHHRSDVANADA